MTTTTNEVKTAKTTKTASKSKTTKPAAKTTKAASKPKATKQTENKTEHPLDAQNADNFPEFLQDVSKVKEVKAEIMTKTKAANQLAEITGNIRQEVGNVANSFCRIGFMLWTVKENKLYFGGDFKNVYEYGEKVLGFQRSSVKNYISICERFCVRGEDGKPTAQLVDNFASFSYTQLSLMLALPDDECKDITPDATCKEIRDRKKAAKGGSGASGDSDNGEDSEQTTFKDKQEKLLDLIFDQEFTGANADVIHSAMFKYIGYEVKVYVQVGRFLYDDKNAAE